jgi:hypothetical protein
MFSGCEFVLTFAQVLPPSALDAEALKAILAGETIEATVVTQLVMPVEKFAEMATNFAALVERLRDQGQLPAPKEAARRSRSKR